MPWVARYRRHSSWALMGTTYIVVVHITYLLTFPWWVQLYVQLTVVDQIDPINLLFFIIIHYFHYYHYFDHYHHYSHFCCWKSGTHSVVTLLWTVKCVIIHFIYHSILICLVLFHSFGFHLVCDTAFGMQHTKFLGGYVWPSDLWVVFRSPRITYYTSSPIGFNVNYSYLYLYKI